MLLGGLCVSTPLTQRKHLSQLLVMLETAGLHFHESLETSLVWRRALSAVKARAAAAQALGIFALFASQARRVASTDPKS